MLWRHATISPIFRIRKILIPSWITELSFKFESREIEQYKPKEQISGLSNMEKIKMKQQSIGITFDTTEC